MSTTFLYGGNSSIQTQLFDTVDALVGKYLVPAEAKNYYPILKTEIPINEGITIRGTFQTDDDSPEGRLSYVTVGRSYDSYDTTEGLGFAWKRSDAGQSDEPNIFLVNNSADSVNDLFVAPNTMVMDQGEMRFHVGVKKQILINTPYSFRLDIQKFTYAMNLWIWATESGEPTFSEATRIAYKGSFTPNATGMYFGVSVVGTKGSEWYYDNFTIDSLSGTHLATLFKMKATSTYYPSTGEPITLKLYGYGDDGVTPGLSVFVGKNLTQKNTEPWEYVGQNTAINTTALSQRLIEKTLNDIDLYRDAEDNINILATSSSASGLNSLVGINYVAINNAYPSGIHLGGVSDVYINDPTSISYGTLTLVNDGHTIGITANNGFNLPIHSLDAISLDFTGDELIPVEDWTYSVPFPGNAFSIRENSYLHIAPQYAYTRIKIGYRYYTRGAAVQSYLDTSANRIIGLDNLAKILPPILVKINLLEYKGTAVETIVKKALIDFINTNPTTLNISDILKTVYSIPNVEYINTATIDITTTEYDHLRNIVAENVSLFSNTTRADLRAFFCDMTLANGVRKL